MKNMVKRKKIAKRIAQELEDWDLINLGIGIPTLIPNYIPRRKEVIIHSENGIIGMGPSPSKEKEDEDVINAAGEPVTFKNDASFVDSATSFGIIRGGHLDAVILGTLQVDENGNISNWQIPEKYMPGIGGAMDLAVGAKKVIIATMHTTKKGKPKILKRCTLPYTAKAEADLIVTDLAVIKVASDGLHLIEIANGISVKEVREKTEAKLKISNNLKKFS